MALQTLTGVGIHYPPNMIPRVSTPIIQDTAVIDATGEKLAFVGYVWFAERTGTKDIQRVGFRFGAVTKAGGSALTVSLQNVLTASGSIGVPDETQDETVAIANADASFVSNTWYRTGTLSVDRTVSYGDLLAVVVEYDGGGRLGADSVALSGITVDAGATFAVTVHKAGSWTVLSRYPNLVLEFDDGTFGTLYGALPLTTITNQAPTSASSPDEYGTEFSLPFPAKMSGFWGQFLGGNARDFTVSIYENAATSAMSNGSVAVDGNTTQTAALLGHIPTTAQVSLAANTNYIIAIQANGASATQAQEITVADAKHKLCWGIPEAGGLRTRTDVSGSWNAVVTTKFILVGAMLSAFDDGTGGVAGSRGMTGGLPLGVL